jgi:hypothetical protein
LKSRGNIIGSFEVNISSAMFESHVVLLNIKLSIASVIQLEQEQWYIVATSMFAKQTITETTPNACEWKDCDQVCQLVVWLTGD